MDGCNDDDDDDDDYVNGCDHAVDSDDEDYDYVHACDVGGMCDDDVEYASTDVTSAQPNWLNRRQRYSIDQFAAMVVHLSVSGSERGVDIADLSGGVFLLRQN